jgi:hypothetical protein
MTTRPRALLARTPWVGTGYALVLVGAHVWLRAQSPAHRASVLAASSTDLVHLERAPWLVLPASALWPGPRWYYWVVAALVCVGSLEAVRGRLAASVVSEGQVAVRIAIGDLPESARRLLDVGPSYIVLGCGVAVIASVRAPLLARLACLAVLLPLATVAFDSDSPTLVAAVGHTVAVAVGVAAALAWQWRSVRERLAG